ncbi:hypothetical protein CHS0354_013322, partial [Potamilus streckersoni]
YKVYKSILTLIYSILYKRVKYGLMEEGKGKYPFATFAVEMVFAIMMSVPP